MIWGNVFAVVQQLLLLYIWLKTLCIVLTKYSSIKGIQIQPKKLVYKIFKYVRIEVKNKVRVVEVLNKFDIWNSYCMFP